MATCKSTFASPSIPRKESDYSLLHSILLSLRDYQDEKGDVILKYSADEARSLKAYGELPESAKVRIWLASFPCTKTCGILD